MSAELTSRGYFFLPGAPLGVIPGAIQAVESGISVDLDGTFQQPAALFDVSATYPVVHGTLQGGEAVSLHGVYQTATYGGGYIRESLGISYCVVGEHLPQAPTFDELHFQFDHLADWLGRSGLSMAAGRDGPRSLRVTSSPPSELRATLEDGNVLTIGFEQELHSEQHLQQIRERPVGRAECKAELPVRALTERYLVPLRDLVTFATLVPAVVGDMAVTTPRHTVPTSSGGQAKPGMPIYQPLIQPDAELRKGPPLWPGRMLFRFEDWRGTFEQLMRAWWRLREEQTAALSIVLGLSYAPPRWSDSRLLAWAQAFEAYHRIQFTQSPATKRAAERAERVLESCPGADKQWLRLRLRHAEEPTLRKRVGEVSRRVSALVEPLLTQHPNFNGRLSDVRNLYAHFGAVSEASGGATGAELHVLALVAQWVLIANVLLDLGFDKDQVKDLVQRNEHFKWLADNPQPMALG